MSCPTSVFTMRRSSVRLHGTVSLRALWLCVIAAGTSACIHVIHPTEVQPGWSADVLVGQDRIGLTSGSQAGQTYKSLALQLNAGYGWRFSDERGLSLKALVPLAPENAAVASGLDVYGQLLHSPLDLGVGAVLGYAPVLYVQGGHGFELGAHRLGIDIGLRTGATVRTVAPFILGSYEVYGMSLGLWAEQEIITKEIKMVPGFGLSDDQYGDSHFAVGCSIGYRYR